MLTPAYEIRLSPSAKHVWDWFATVGQWRQHGMDGAQPLLPTDLASWQALTRTPVRAEEWVIIMAMDAALLRAMRDLRPEGKGAPSEAASSRPLSPKLFDAIF